MAKVLDPFGAREARGSVGGVTASRNTMGQYLKVKASPVQPRTETQQSQRYLFQRQNRGFQNLTVARITAWNDFAKAWPFIDVFGNSIHGTGLNWYIGLNTRLERAGVSMVLDPPLNPNPTFTPSFSLTQAASLPIKIRDISPTPSGNERVWVYYTGNHPRSSQFAKKDMRLREILDSTVSNPHELIQLSALSQGDSLRQFHIFAVDANGRATPVQRRTIYPT